MDIEKLHRHALIAYELGRLRMATRVFGVVAPLALLGVAVSEYRSASLCIALILAVAAVALRWRDRCGAAAVAVGLRAGVLMLAVGVASCLIPLPNDTWIAICALLCIVAAFAAGFWIGMRPVAPGDLVTRAAPMAVALLTAALGCVDLGFSMLLGIVLAMILGQVIGGRINIKAGTA